MGKLCGKIAIVTGATSGIGAEIAVEYAKEGATVVVSGRNAERGEKTLARVKEAGADGIFVACDTSKEEDVKNLINCTIETYGRLDILVNNAGVYFTKELEDTEVEEWERLYDINVKGYFMMCKYAVGYLEASKGNIVNIASFAGLGVSGPSYAYSSSKASVIHLTKLIAKNYGPKGIRANAICPGVIQTPIFGGADMSAMGPAFPLQRVGQPVEIARPAVFLASEDASYITGAVLSVDGGMVL